MSGNDLILNGLREPAFNEIDEYFNRPVRPLWKSINDFIQQTFTTQPKLSYSKCAAQPGWNIKYHKSGKSVCTLYPEKDSLISLIVVSLELLPVIEAMSNHFEPDVKDTIESVKPFNGTLWLMIRIDREAVLENVKELLLLKHRPPS